MQVDTQLKLRNDWTPKLAPEIDTELVVPAGTVGIVQDLLADRSVVVAFHDYNLHASFHPDDVKGLFTVAWAPEPLHPVDRNAPVMDVPSPADSGRTRRRRS